MLSGEAIGVLQVKTTTSPASLISAVARIVNTNDAEHNVSTN